MDYMILLDRQVDPLSPLVTQLTYEGLIDEFLGITNSKAIIYTVYTYNTIHTNIHMHIVILSHLRQLSFEHYRSSQTS